MGYFKNQSIEKEQELLIEEFMWSAERDISELSKACRSSEEFSSYVPRLQDCIDRGLQFLIEQEAARAGDAFVMTEGEVNEAWEGKAVLASKEN